ncbi:MAG TPA: 3-methyl-2-oxobutanoate dehydrogenase subunit VorB [Spirochaetia bacterium]|nr:3-methyl-2-oxobutanoate dehydrogenase subunit VorB [Spirochaetia bacterium]
MALILMKGNEAIGEAAIIAGCRYYFGYPITPQNELPAYMSMRMPKVGGTFLQAESEVAAINMVFGAAAAGARVMTSSSSPGISLKMEGVSYMAGAELPAVVVNMMRGGPGLGNIAGAQGDYFQAVKGGGHGDYHSIVLAPSGVQELADLTVKAFDLADRYRIVVILLGDGFIGQMSEPISLPQPSGLVFDKSAWALTGAKDRDTHHIVSLRLNPEDALEKLNIRLQAKYREVERRETLFEESTEYRGAESETDGAEFLLVGFGLSARICRSAVSVLRKSGIKVGFFRPITLWPFPRVALAAASAGKKKVLVVEMNAGQMVEDVRLAVAGAAPVDFYGTMGGITPLVDTIVERIKAYAR